MQQQPRLPLWFLLANWALIAAAFWLGIQLGGGRYAALPDAQRAALALVHREILQSHVDPQDPAELVERAIAAMVASLDPYSRYVPPREVARYEESNTGEYEGIGAEFGTYGDAVVLHFPLADGPAERAGLRPGDRLLAVDGTRLDSAASRARVVELVRGPAGSDVRLLLQRDAEPFEQVVRRGGVKKPCVRWAHRLPDHADLGYVHLTDFHPGAAGQLFATIDALRAAGPLRGLVLDLRTNRGGQLDECIAIARAFVPQGVIVSQHRRDGEIVELHEAKPEQCRYPELPLVLLVDGDSASASEVLAGALQDHARAAIVGQRTHGKAFVNTQYTWPDHEFRLKLTTGRYRTPKGRDIERHHRKDGEAPDGVGGIAPDVPVALTAAERIAALSALRATEPPAAWREAFAAAAARHGIPVPQPPAAGSDAQLAKAVATLHARAGTAAAGDRPPEPGRDK